MSPLNRCSRYCPLEIGLLPVYFLRMSPLNRSTLYPYPYHRVTVSEMFASAICRDAQCVAFSFTDIFRYFLKGGSSHLYRVFQIKTKKSDNEQ